MNSTCFILPGPDHWASSRIRGIWPAKFMPDATTAVIGSKLPEADTYIWVKSFNPDLVRQYKQVGKRNYLDFCDPAWWWAPSQIRHALDDVDHVICSCQAIANDFQQEFDYKPLIIRDRMWLPHFDKQHTHKPIDRGQPVRFIWYGGGQNRHSLLGAMGYFERLVSNGVQISLTIMDDKPREYWEITDLFPVSNIKWELAKEVEVIAAHDIAMLPPYPGPWGRLKTNNKALHAWACNVAVSDGMDWPYLWQLATSTEFRTHAAAAGRRMVETDYNVEQSAAEWLEVLNGN